MFELVNGKEKMIGRKRIIDVRSLCFEMGSPAAHLDLELTMQLRLALTSAS